MSRAQQIRGLEASLSRLVDVLRLDPRCQWTKHFEISLAETRDLMSKECSQADLNTLSSSVVYVYGGMDSFSDYTPGAYDLVSEGYVPIEGSEQFDELSSRVYEQARALRAEISRARRLADAVLRIASFAIGLVVGASAGTLILYWPALFDGKYMLAWGWVGMPLGFIGAIYVCFVATRKIYRFSSKQLQLTSVGGVYEPRRRSNKTIQPTCEDARG